LHDVIFDEGGATPCYEHVLIKNNDIETGMPDGQATSPAPSQPLTPTAIASCPKCNAHAPVKDDDPCYSITSYGPQPCTTEHASIAHADVSKDPRTYTEAMAHPNATEWELACNDEKRSFDTMGIYEVVPCPKWQKVVGSKWVFHIKRGPDGAIQKYKAHVVAQGFTQIKGVDYNETFAPIAKLSSL